jgi:hypothetical protein
MLRSRVLLCVTAALVAGWLIATPPARAQAVREPIEYNKHIRPILTENCFSCHGPDSASREAGLRLDIREEAIAAGAIVPGKSSESEMIARIFSESPKKVMPQPKTHKKLTPAQKELLKRWVDAGAEYQPHWAFIPPKRPAVPTVKNQAWVRNPIDAFVLAELERVGLSPAPEADRRTLARRMALDLIGLPPTPEQVEAYVNDKAPNADERFIEMLMKSPHWGEHRGRYWLDAARYGDTHGIHFDNYREMWSYRDWVIDAFNRNMPFDQFTIEQLAGDLLPNRTLEQLIATGFNRCNITTNEGGVIGEEYLVLYTRDRVETTASVWLGLTASCAPCHDHKYDPLSQKDFYRLAAFFNNTTQGAMDGNIKDTPPVVQVPLRQDRERFAQLNQEIGQLQAKLNERKNSIKPDLQNWLNQTRPEAVREKLPSDQLHLHAAFDEGKGDEVRIRINRDTTPVKLQGGFGWAAGQVADKALRFAPNVNLSLPTVGDFEKDQPFSYGAWVFVPRGNVTGAVFARMDEAAGFRGWDLWLAGGKVSAHLLHRWPDDGIKVRAEMPLTENQWHHIFVTYDGKGKAAGVQIYINGIVQTARVHEADSLRSSIRTNVPFKLAQRNNSGQIGPALQDVRIYQRALSADEVAQIARGTRAAFALQQPADRRTPQQLEELAAYYLAVEDPVTREVSQQLNLKLAEQTAIRSRGTVAHVMQERPTPPEAYVLTRGEYDKRGERVTPGVPAFLPPMPKDAPLNRLGFAHWLLQPEHPLTARVTVNRFWQEVFGQGLVSTTGDFGLAGASPSHPELLDWLAVEFRESGWNVQHLFKLMLTSATYRQAALVTKDRLEKDPANRLYSRGPRFRLDAEMIRDYVLAASGILVPKIGGPSVKPYQPEGVWEAVAMIGSNTRDYRRDSGENLYRRSLYTFWKRAAPPAMLEVFNAPNREFCTVKRERTNTPLQALATLNDIQYIEAARFLAERTMKQGGESVESRLDFMARRILCRPLRPEEAKILDRTYHALLAHYREQPAAARQLISVGESKADASLDVPTLAALTMTANQLFNLDEVLNK